MKRLKLSITGLLFAVFAAQANAAIDALACEPEWGALLRELGGDQVRVYNATSALQDPHRIEARPSLIAQARKAEILVCTGAELETGWLPLLLRQSGNAAIQSGKPGYFEAAAQVKRLEVPDRLDRADGDVHASGNPHIHTDPRNITLVAEALASRLAEIDVANAAYYQQRHIDFSQRWQAAIKRWEARAAPLKGVRVVVQHKAFPYLSAWLGLQEVAVLEAKPGLEPSSSQLAAVLARLQAQPARMVIRAAYQHDRPSRWLSEQAKIPAVELPYTVGGSAAATDLFGLFDDTLERLLAAVR